MHVALLLQVDALEQDALEVLGLVRSMENNLAPINQIPSDIFSHIPEYLEGGKDLITMTHVCRSWRELLITRPSLWVRLHCENVDRTRVYIERSKSAPLKLSLYDGGDVGCLEDPFLLVVPHIKRIKSLAINAGLNLLHNLTPLLFRPAPLLSELIIHCGGHVLDTRLFNGDLPSLCSLSLSGVTTHLPWKNLSKLTTFKLCHVPEGRASITELLDFLEGAHHLRDITLDHSIPTSSDAPPGRVVSLPHLKQLTIYANPVHSILLNHLSIPTGASLALNFEFTGNKSPVPDFLPTTHKNLGNIFPISSVSLSLDTVLKNVRLSGPNGRLHLLGRWKDWEDGSIFTLDRRILRSLSLFDLSGAQRLAVAQYESPTVDIVDKSAPYRILSRMKDLRTLTLSQCNNVPFILALNPDQNSSKRVPCPKLEELVLYVEGLGSFNIEELMRMAKERASAGIKLSSITVVGLGELLPGWEVFKLREYITHVDYKVGEKPLRWDDVHVDEGY